MNYGRRFVTLYRRQGSRPSIPKKKKCKKAKWLSEEALQIAVKRREAKIKGEKERYTHLNAEFQRIARRLHTQSCLYRSQECSWEIRFTKPLLQSIDLSMWFCIWSQLKDSGFKSILACGISLLGIWELFDQILTCQDLHTFWWNWVLHFLFFGDKRQQLQSSSSS